MKFPCCDLTMSIIDREPVKIITVRMDATITEFIYVPNTVEDGEYLLNLMIAPFENDATPSKPILYKIIK